MNSNRRVKRPIVACIMVFFAASLSATGSEDPLLTLACGAGIALTIGLLWRLDEPPVLLLPVGIQLAQVVTPLLYANLLGVPVQEVSLNIGDLAEATWLGLAAMVSLAVGMWCGQLSTHDSAASIAEQEFLDWSPRTAFMFCIATICVGGIFDALSEYFAGMRQPLLAAAGIQWLGVFLLASVCMAQWRGFGYLLTATCLEVVKGFTGYFSEFRLVFFVLIIATFAGGATRGSRKAFMAIVVGSGLLILGAWWSSIKDDYRHYLDQGSNQQVVLVPVEDRIAFLMDKLFETDERKIGIGFKKLERRIGYVDYLAATMRHIPAHMPFQEGAQIGATVMNVIEPRLLFPDKPPLPSDTDILQKYTGIHFGKSSSIGSSVSIGYVAELYADFGVIGVVVGTFIMGLLAGRAFRFIISSGSMPVSINYGLAVMLAITITQFDEALIKIVGSFVTVLAVILALRRFFLPNLLVFLGLPDRRRVLAPAAE
jgi:hypothetical protein